MKYAFGENASSGFGAPRRVIDGNFLDQRTADDSREKELLLCCKSPGIAVRAGRRSVWRHGAGTTTRWPSTAIAG